MMMLLEWVLRKRMVWRRLSLTDDVSEVVAKMVWLMVPHVLVHVYAPCLQDGSLCHY